MELATTGTSEALKSGDGREIIICVTFREFDGSMNDLIQRRFLDSVARQTYRNFRLVVTNFRERRVKYALSEYSLPFEFVQSELDTRLSLTNVLQSGIDRLSPGKSILMYTNADHVFPPQFLAEVARHFEPGCSGTFYPQLVYNSLEDFDEGRPCFDAQAAAAPGHRGPFNSRDPGLPDWLQVDPNYWVMDVTFADGDLMLAKEHRSRLEKFRFDAFWPGPTQSILLTSYSPPALRKNLFFRTRYAEIVNVYGASRELDAAQNYSALRAAEFKTVEPLKKTMRDFARDAGSDAVEFDDPLLAKLRHAERFTVVGDAGERELFEMYLQFWRVRYQVHEHAGMRGLEPNVLQILEQMRELLRASYQRVFT